MRTRSTCRTVRDREGKLERHGEKNACVEDCSVDPEIVGAAADDCYLGVERDLDHEVHQQRMPDRRDKPLEEDFEVELHFKDV